MNLNKIPSSTRDTKINSQPLYLHIISRLNVFENILYSIVYFVLNEWCSYQTTKLLEVVGSGLVALSHGNFVGLNQLQSVLSLFASDVQRLSLVCHNTTLSSDLKKVSSSSGCAAIKINLQKWTAVLNKLYIL